MLAERAACAFPEDKSDKIYVGSEVACRGILRHSYLPSMSDKKLFDEECEGKEGLRGTILFAVDDSQGRKGTLLHLLISAKSDSLEIFFSIPEKTFQSQMFSSYFDLHQPANER